ncbi:hypothetical protein FQN60_011529 [Etheostoma spectabile]|uniref:Uncharacterized protein n=1 Tax=Etheostoma spectabile TaxID=54343 RepID=A0A5J5CFS6_9PERO|nr:hypothetical protein FQN60_011529 [Etheostoma spectabile]
MRQQRSQPAGKQPAIIQPQTHKVLQKTCLLPTSQTRAGTSTTESHTVRRKQTGKTQSLTKDPGSGVGQKERPQTYRQGPHATSTSLFIRGEMYPDEPTATLTRRSFDSILD